MEARRTVVHLVNLNPVEARELVVQAGAFGEHSFDSVEGDSLTSLFPGPAVPYAADPVTSAPRTARVDSRHLAVELPPATEITLDLSTRCYVNEPLLRSGPF